MKMKLLYMRVVLTVIVMILSLAGTRGLYAQTAKQDAIVGEWTNEARDKKITFYQLPDKTFEAKVSWMKDTLANRKAIGKVIAKHLVFKEGEYTGGKIYSPKTGWVNASAEVKDEHTLLLTGSKSFISKTQTWTR